MSKSVYFGYKNTSGAGNSHFDDGTIHANMGKTSQGTNATALGPGAGANSQGTVGVALGKEAGRDSQSEGAVAIGSNTAYNQQGLRAVAIGSAAGAQTQQPYSVAVGYLAGQNTQGQEAIAIGARCAIQNQGTRAVALGFNAVAANQAAKSIAINATGIAITAPVAGLYVAPVRDENVEVSGKVMCYNTSTKEVILRNPPPASTVTESTFNFDATAFFQFYSDSYVTFTWTTFNQVRFQTKAPYAVNVNAGQYLTKSGAFSVTGGRFNVAVDEVKWFSIDGNRNDAFALANSGNHVRMWLSGGNSAAVPYYTVELMGGTVALKMFGVVRTYSSS